MGGFVWFQIELLIEKINIILFLRKGYVVWVQIRHITQEQSGDSQFSKLSKKFQR